MEPLIARFDPDSNAVLSPNMVIPPVRGFPRVAVTTFSDVAFRSLYNVGDVRQIGSLSTANGLSPIYEIDYQGIQVALFVSRVGAPASAVGFEEIIAMGVRKLVMFGCCGVLDNQIPDGHLIVPTHALRDEGTSYHYLPPADEIELNPGGVAAITAALDGLEYPYIKGKTWTNDAVYRETRQKVAQRKSQGCIAVEMECAAMAAVAQFRQVTFAQFLYAADNLDAPVWERRSLGDHALSKEEFFLALALESAVRLPSYQNTLSV